VLVLERTSKLALWTWRPLYSLLRRERVDILHAHKFGSNVWGTIIGRLARVPVVVAHEHSWSYEGNPLRRLLDREVVGRGADAFVAVSREDRRRMIEIEHVRPDVIRLLPNGIPAPERRGYDVRAELGIAPDAPVVVTVGQLRPEKELGQLIEAAAALAPRYPSLRVLIAGDGPEEVPLRRTLADQGLEPTVMLLGRRDDVPDVLAAADIAVCCSAFEGSPLSVMEYMAAALPTVATRVGGVPDLIEHGRHGLLIPPGDAHALAGAIGSLLDDREGRREMGERASERQQAEFDFDVLVERVEALYEELFAATRRARREGWAPARERVAG
jgi:glycosyltransferase involved in cell wall biosynthesis